MNKHKLLLCLPDCPFPVRRNGLSIRWAPLIQHFSKTFDIDLLVISPAVISNEDLEACKEFCITVNNYVKKSSVRVPVVTKIYTRLISFVPGTTPFDFVYYNQWELNDFFKKHYASMHYDLIIAVSKTFVPMIRQFASYKRLTLDVIDSSYALKLREAKSIVDQIDAWLIRFWEQKMLRSVDCSSFISVLDRELSCGTHIDSDRVLVIPNGVYLNDLDLDNRIDFGGPTIGFLGNMSYGPNIQAALRLYKLYKKVQDSLPNLKMVVIGRDPVADISELSADAGVIVTGTIDNIGPYVNSIDLFVFGMQIGSGQQNKLLDAMAAKKPVITTTLGNSGVNAVDRQSVVIADTDQEIESAILELMQSIEKRKYIGEQGYKFVMQTYSWDEIFKKFDMSIFSVN